MTREDLVTEMLRLNGQATCVDSPVARLYMGRVLDFATLQQVGDPAAPVAPAGKFCTHTPPGVAGREGDSSSCRCGRVKFHWVFRNKRVGSGWEVTSGLYGKGTT